MPKSFQNRQLQPGGVIKDTYEQINLNSAEINADLVELYGKDVELQSQLTQIINETDLNPDKDPEVTNARGTFQTVGLRLDDVDSQLTDILLQQENLETEKADKTELELKADITYVSTLAESIASGSPKGVYATLAALQEAFPTGTSGVYVVSADGKWYYWNGSVWAAGGSYQTTAVEGIINVDYSPTYLGNELVANASFETWSSTLPALWAGLIGSGAITKDTATPFEGSNAIKLTHGNVMTSYDTQISQDVAVTPGEVYEFSFWTKGDGANGITYAVYRNTAPAGYIVGNVITNLNLTDWTKVTREITIPAGCLSIKLFFFAPNVDGAFAFVDKVSFRVKNTGNKKGVPVPIQVILDNYPSKAITFDKTNTNLDSVNVQDVICEINDKTKPILNFDYAPTTYGAELLPNVGFENWSGAVPDGWLFSNTGGFGTFTKDSSPKEGINSLKLTKILDGPWYYPQLVTPDIPVDPSDLYELSFWTKGDGIHAGFFAILSYPGDVYLTESPESTGVTGDIWTKVTKRITIPEGSTSVKVLLLSATPTGSFACFDLVSLKKVITLNLNGVPTPIELILNNLPSKAITFNNAGTQLVSTDVENAIKEVASTLNTNKVVLNLPNKYELVVGDTFELFYKGIILANNPYNYQLKVIGTKGASYKRKYIFTPTAGDIGTSTLTFSLYDDNEKLLSTKTVSLIVKAKAANPASVKTILNIGDSLTSGGVWVTELHKRLVITDGLTNLKFIGTAGTTVKHEGYGGWNYNTFLSGASDGSRIWINGAHNKTASDQHAVYKDSNNTQWKLETIEIGKIKLIRISGTTPIPASGSLTWVSGGTDTSNIVYTSTTSEASNPFWNELTSQIDFANYISELGETTLDYVNIFLGWNSSNDSEATYKANARAFINAIKASYPNAKITLIGLQVPDIDGFGANYGVSNLTYYNSLKFVFNQDKWHRDLVLEYTNVDCINLAGQFDTENNHLSSLIAVNVRNATTEKVGINAVHPDTPGYNQIADAVYRNIVHKI